MGGEGDLATRIAQEVLLGGGGGSSSSNEEVWHKKKKNNPAGNKRKRVARDMNAECAVCLNPLQPNNIVHKTLCDHYFHAGCLQTWHTKYPTCPICRERLPWNFYATFDNFQSNLLNHFESGIRLYYATPGNRLREWEKWLAQNPNHEHARDIGLELRNIRAGNRLKNTI